MFKPAWEATASEPSELFTIERLDLRRPLDLWSPSSPETPPPTVLLWLEALSFLVEMSGGELAKPGRILEVEDFRDLGDG